MRSYQETLDFLFSQLPMFTRIGASAFKKDLSNTLALCEVLDQPQAKFKCIHVAGTNGKGSTSHMLASIFQEAGYKTGLYTSPHLRDFRERIRVNGAMISEAEVIEFTHRLEEDFERIKPSFFEMTVAMAFNHFAKHQVDIAIIETGMGGRLDSTNVVMPELSVITNIGFDHMEFLGDTLPLIAGEKAGIIKKHVPAVVGKRQSECDFVFEQKAKELDAPLVFASDVFLARLLQRDYLGQELEITRNNQVYKRFHLDLPGTYQLENCCTVLQAVERIKDSGKFHLSEDAISQGIAKVKSNTGLLGRWHCLAEKPLTLCDTGHNEDGIKHILAMLKATSHETLHFVIGMVRDKDITKILNMLPKEARYYFTQAAIPRAMPFEEFATAARACGLHGEAYPTVKEAYEAAQQMAKETDLIFVGGSTFVVAEVV